MYSFSNKIASYYFGDGDSATIGRIIYDNSADKLMFYTGSVNRVSIGTNLNLAAQALLATPVAGNIEFDGTFLYFTTTSGVRKKLAEVA